MEERKELTKRAKATLDDLNLQLQNLVYEEAHYNKEIQHCRDFRPREVVHDLLPAPPSGTEAAAKPDEDEESRAHRLMTQRLAAELEERKRHEVEALTTRKAALQEANQAKRKFLHGLRSRLQTIAQAAEPAQQHFGYTSTEKTDSFDTAGQLPTPLYTLFAQLNAHKLAFDTGIGVSVGGDAEVALALNAQLSRRGSTVATRLMAERTESQTDNKPHQFAVHPLAVLLHFPNGDDMAQGVALKLRFEYLYELNVVGVRVEHGDETLLHNLYPRDIGLTSPNPANRYLFDQEVSIKQGYAGRAYKWAQWAAGLGFAQEERGLPGRPHVASIIQRLKARIRDHRSLNTQLNLLGKGMIPGQPHAALHIWKEISAAEFQASELLGAAGAAGLEDGEVGSRAATGREAEGLPWHAYASRHFYALLKKPEFELEVFARVGTEYPYRPPEWRLRWKVYNGKRGWVPYTFPAAVSADAHPTALDAVGRASPCDNQLKALEMRLNSAWDTKQGEESMLLSHQCVVLQTGFERLVEACRSTTAPGRSRTPLHGRARLAPIV